MPPSPPHAPGELERLAWAYHTGPMRALDYRFAVRTTDAALGSFLDRALAGFHAAPAPWCPHTTYSLLDAARTGGRTELYVDGELTLNSSTPAGAVDRLVWHLNRRVLATSRGRVLVHAAGAVCSGIGLLLPGGPEAGKTTLVAGLVRSGFGYLGDEIVAVDPDRLELGAYPKPLSVDPGSWKVLADLAPDGTVAPYFQRQWQVPPEDICRGALVAGAPARLVIAPRYRDGTTTRLEPVSRAEMLLLLGEQTFAGDLPRRRCLEVLGALLRRCACYRLEIGSLEEACGALEAAVSEHV